MKFIIAFLISLFFFSLTYASSFEEFKRTDLFMVLGFLLIAVVLQSLLSLIVKKWNTLQNLIMAFFTVANIVTVNLILNENFIGLSTLLKASGLSVGVFIVFTLLNIFEENKKIGQMAIFAGIIAASYNFGGTLITSKESEVFAIKPTGTSSNNIKIVKFEKKPNVYIILFDSLIPTSLMKKNMGSERAAYHDVLDQHFLKFDNFFVERVPSRPSLNRLLALDSKYYSKLKQEKGNLQFRMFQGFAPSPLFQIFEANGYETNTLYNSRYFGKAQGPYINNYLVNRDFGACEFIERKLKKYTLFGICNFGIKYEPVPAVDFLIRNMSQGLKRNRPQIIVSYIYSPGHTAKGYDHNDLQKRQNYRLEYMKNSKITADSLNKIIDFLKKNDPGAILFLSGDHGPWLSRRTRIRENRRFYVQDRYAVYGGVYNNGNCTNSFSKAYTDHFITTSQVSHMIIRCLTNGIEAFIKQDEYKFFIKNNKRGRNYGDFLYE
jgi:hypothetical protein